MVYLERFKTEGENRLTKLLSLLIEQGDTKNMQKAIVDKEYRGGLYRKYSVW